MKKHAQYCINSQYINIDSLAKKYNGDMQSVCFEIEKRCLVTHDVALYYADLYLHDKPFKEKCSPLSIAALALSIVVLIFKVEAIQILLGITIVAFIVYDLLNGRKQVIPKKHFLNAIAAILCMIAITSCTDETSENRTNISDTEISETTEKSDDTEISEKSNKVKVGEDFIYHDKIAVKFKKFYEVNDSEWYKPEKGNRLVAFELEITNNGDDDFVFSSSSASGYADNVKVDTIITEKTDSICLSAGRTGTVTLTFEIPKDAKNIEMEYEFNYFTEARCIFIGK